MTNDDNSDNSDVPGQRNLLRLPSQGAVNSLILPRRQQTAITLREGENLGGEEESAQSQEEISKNEFSASVVQSSTASKDGNSKKSKTDSQVMNKNPSSLPDIRSQKEVQERFEPLLRKSNKTFRKCVSAFIRPAERGEEINTIADGKFEFSYCVKDDTSWVVAGKVANEYYVISNQKFQDNYDQKSKKPILATKIVPTTAADGNNSGSNNDEIVISSLQASRYRRRNFYEYQSLRIVRSYQVNEEDMSWFRCKEETWTPTAASTAEAYFESPWEEETRIELGDFLVMTYPDANDGVYRIEHTLFERSYEENSIDGFFKDLKQVFEINNHSNLDILWPVVQSLLDKRSEHEIRGFAKLQDSNNRTALQIAQKYDAPFSIVEKLFYANPNVLTDVELKFFVGTYRGDISMQQNTLHLACLYNAPSSVIELICKKCPEAVPIEDAKGWLPLHFACKAKVLDLSTIPLLKNAHPAALMMATTTGETPLILAIKREEMSYSVVKWLTTDTVAKMADEKGLLPLHYACIYGASEEILNLLIWIYADGMLHKDLGGRTPFDYALESNSADTVKALYNLTDKDMLAQCDEKGRLPLHRACIHGILQESLEFLAVTYPEGISAKASDGRTPFQYAVKDFKESSNAIGSIKVLLKTHGVFVDAEDHDTTEKFFKLPKEIFEDEDIRSSLANCLNFMLQPRPDSIQDEKFFDGLKDCLSTVLQDDFFQHILDDENITDEQKHRHIELFFNKFNNAGFQRVMIRSLESKNSKVCTDWMNKKSCKRSIVVSLMIQLYMHCIWISLFIGASVRYLTEPTLKPYRIHAILLFPCAGCFVMLELFQFYSFQTTGAAGYYFMDLWNYLDVTAIALVLVSASVLLMSDPAEPPDSRTETLLISTGFFIFLELVSFIRKGSLSFAIFVGGVLQIFVKLIPFAVSTGIALGAFAFMFFVDRNNDDYYETFFTSFLTTFSAFVGEPSVAQNWLDVVFGIVTVVVLLNVVIAIVSREWDDAIRDASKVFWKYRLDFLFEVSPGQHGGVLAKTLGKLDCIDEPLNPRDMPEDIPLFFFFIRMLSFGTADEAVAENNTGIGDQSTGCTDSFVNPKECSGTGNEEDAVSDEEENREGEWEEKFKRNWADGKAPLWTYVVFYLFYAMCLLAGLVSVGLLWPRTIRRRLFEAQLPHNQSNVIKKIILEKVETLERLSSKELNKLHERVDRMEEKLNERVDLMEEKLNERVDRMEGKMDKVLDHMNSILDRIDNES